MDKSKFNDKREWRKFGIALGIILAIVATVLSIKQNSIDVYFYGAGAAVVLLALTLPILIKPVFIMFMYIGHVMGWVMTRVILGILFYLVMTPLSLVARLIGKRFLDLRFTRKEDSYWIENPVSASGQVKESYEQQY